MANEEFWENLNHLNSTISFYTTYTLDKSFLAKILNKNLNYKYIISNIPKTGYSTKEEFMKIFESNLDNNKQINKNLNKIDTLMKGFNFRC